MAGIATMYKKSPLEAHKKLHDLLFEKISEQIDSMSQYAMDQKNILSALIGILLSLIYEMESSIHMYAVHPHVFFKFYARLLISKLELFLQQFKEGKRELQRIFKKSPLSQDKRAKLEALFEAGQKYLLILLKECSKIIMKSKIDEVHMEDINNILKELKEVIENIKSSLQ